ncbi:MAG: pentapeptide repeat-containing protein [candidate division Zixibacteria bacterium]
MPEEIKTCQGQIWDPSIYTFKTCNRPLYDDKHCICHSDDPDKDIEKFRTEVQKQLDREDYHDFTEFVFPKDFNFRETEFKHDVYFRLAKFGGKADFYSAKFDGDANFYHAKFDGDANFYHAEFGGEASFYEAEFGGEASFYEAKFGGEAYFLSTKFDGQANFGEAKFGGNANFWNTKFDGEIDFRWAGFGGKADFISATFKKTVNFKWMSLSEKTIVRFDGENNKKDEPVFQDTADFSSIRIPEDAEIVFRKINLSKCEFLETDLTKVEFIDVNWAKTGGIFKWFKTNAVYDAVKNGKNGKYDYDLIAQLYRRLQINYIGKCFYSEAGDFHIGEQEMARKGKGEFSRFFCTNMFYKLISYYGESFILPLFWLALILILFPALFLYSGIDLQSSSEPAKNNPPVVRYEFSPNPADCFLLTENYKKAFYKNFSFISFNRSEIDKCLVSLDMRFFANLEIIIVIVLLSFFVLALRRPYKRHI